MLTAFPKGASSFGVPMAPGVQGAIDRYWGGGKVLWVGNRSGLPAGDGSSPSYPLSTLFGASGALAKLNATTNRGHVIFVMPGHAENISTADHASNTGAADSFAIVGLGTGTSRPTFTWSVATATWLVDTANVALDNLRLLMAGPAGSTALTVAAPITISAAGCQIRNCYIQTGIDADQLSTDSIITTAAADDLVIENNQVIGAAAAEQTTVFKFIGCDRLVFRNNYVVGGVATDTDGLLHFLTTASTDVLIANNLLRAAATGNETCIHMNTALAHTGWIIGNFMRNAVDGNNNYITTHASANVQLQWNFGVNNNNERGLEEGTASV